MTASLYQSGSPAPRRRRRRRGSGWCAAIMRSSRSKSCSVAHAAAHAEDVRRHASRVELDVVARAAARGSAHRRAGRAPGRARVGVEAERRQVERHPARLRVVRVEVDDDEDGVAAVRRRRPSRRRSAARCRSSMEARGRGRDCSAGFSRRMRFTRAMNVAQAVGAVEVPVRSSYFSESQVLLAARLARRVLQQLVRRAVDAVARRQRRRQHERAP